MKPSSGGLVLEWSTEDKVVYTLFNPLEGKEALLRDPLKIEADGLVRESQLKASVYHLLSQLAQQQSLGGLLVEVEDEVGHERKSLEWGSKVGSLTSLKGAETQDFLAIFWGKTLYSLDKKTGKVTSLSLPFIDSALTYHDILLGGDGYLLTWRLPVGEGKDMVGIVRLPYAR
jgi:hypothetical protein